MSDAQQLVVERKIDYQLAFGSPAGQKVLMDLALFCRAAESCGVPGSHDKTMLAIGRHEVWLRISQHLNLGTQQLFALYSGRNIRVGETND